MQRALSKEIAILQTRLRKDPMRCVQHAIGRTRLVAGVGIGNAQQLRLGLAAQVATPLLAAAHGVLAIKFHLGIKPTPRQVQHLAALLIDPPLDLAVHLHRPVFGVRIEDKRLVAREVNAPKV